MTRKLTFDKRRLALLNLHKTFLSFFLPVLLCSFLSYLIFHFTLTVYYYCCGGTRKTNLHHLKAINFSATCNLNYKIEFFNAFYVYHMFEIDASLLGFLVIFPHLVLCIFALLSYPPLFGKLTPPFYHNM